MLTPAAPRVGEGPGPGRPGARPDGAPEGAGDGARVKHGAARPACQVRSFGPVSHQQLLTRGSRGADGTVAPCWLCGGRSIDTRGQPLVFQHSTPDSAPAGRLWCACRRAVTCTPGRSRRRRRRRGRNGRALRSGEPRRAADPIDYAANHPRARSGATHGVCEAAMLLLVVTPGLVVTATQRRR